MKGGGYFSTKKEKSEQVIMCGNKGFSLVHKKFHLMESKCYALVWGIMHFRQYLYRNHFTFRTNHKPPMWLTMVSNAYGRRKRWINTFQDFCFKILDRVRSRHNNADALSRNLLMLLRKMKMQVTKFRTTRFYEPIVLMMRSSGWGEGVPR